MHGVRRASAPGGTPSSSAKTVSEVSQAILSAACGTCAAAGGGGGGGAECDVADAALRAHMTKSAMAVTYISDTDDTDEEFQDTAPPLFAADTRGGGSLTDMGHACCLAPNDRSEDDEDASSRQRLSNYGGT